jgi:prepilin-type N-terminal cleavage/methylation domain-containing protein
MTSNENLIHESPPGDNGGKGGGILRGFSLIELMLVIAIISILTAIAFISMLHYQLIINVNASARDLGGQMRMVRASAIREGRPYLFTFGANYYNYGVDEGMDGSFDGRAPRKYLQPGIVFGYMANTVQVPGHPYPVTTPVCIHTSGGACGPYFHFLRDGTSTYGGVAYMIPGKDRSGTGARDDRERAVDWTSSSGRIRVWKYNASNHQWR